MIVYATAWNVLLLVFVLVVLKLYIVVFVFMIVILSKIGNFGSIEVQKVVPLSPCNYSGVFCS